MGWRLNETAHAGAEHLDPAFVATYAAKAGLDVAAELDLLRANGLGPETTLVDLGAGSGVVAAAAAPHCRRVVAVDPSPVMLAAARARAAEIECVHAGFLTYSHRGEPPQLVYSRNALHHLPDFWKAIALERVARLLAPGGTFLLRDLVFSFAPAEADEALEAWFAAAPEHAEQGWTREELETHVRDEHSTFDWLLEPMLEHAGFEIREAVHSESQTHSRYVCVRR
jgi:SAM-dependent methyltransferase